MTAHYQSDVCVIGAGPAGASAAALLRRAGYRVLVAEKEKFPRFVIGESLLPRCMDLLEEAGLLAVVEACNFMVKNGAMFLREDQRQGFDFREQFSRGWRYTWQVPRAEFDQALTDAIAQMGVEILWQHTVEGVEFSDRGPRVALRSQSGETAIVDCRFILDGSGYGRVLPRLLDLEAPSPLPRRESLFTHVRGDQRPEGDEAGKIWICMLPQNGWLWIIPFADDRTSVGVVADPSFFGQFVGDLDEQLSAIIDLDSNSRRRLAGREALFSARRISGYSVAVKRLFGDGYALMGNASEFLDPVFSSGVTLALESANRAAKTLIRQLDGQAVDWQRDYVDYMSQGIETFRTYVNAWYDGSLPAIFFSPDPSPEIRRQLCSVLAGYVWDMENPYVAQHAKGVATLAKLCRFKN